MTKITQRTLEQSILSAMGISQDDQAKFCLQATECVAFYTGTRIIWNEDPSDDGWLSLVLGVAHNLYEFMPDKLNNTFGIAMGVFMEGDMAEACAQLTAENKMTYTLAHSVAAGMISVLHDKGILPEEITSDQLIDETLSTLRVKGQVVLESMEPSKIKLRDSDKTFKAASDIEKFMLGMTDQVVGAYLQNPSSSQVIPLESILKLISGEVDEIESVPFPGGSNDKR